MRASVLLPEEEGKAEREDTAGWTSLLAGELRQWQVSGGQSLGQHSQLELLLRLSLALKPLLTLHLIFGESTSSVLKGKLKF